MKITPIEIRQHTFDKALRGYKPEDVDAFLISLSQEWERVTGEYKMMKMQLEIAEKELGKLKEVEMTLFRTLKTAEDTSAQITEQANRAGEKYVADAKQKADDTVADAKKRSALMIQDAENQARYLKDNILNDLKSLEHDFKALEGYKDNLATQIRHLASNAVDSVERFEKKFARQNLKGKIDEVATQIKEEKEKEKPVAEIPQEAPVAELPAPEAAPAPEPEPTSSPVAALPDSTEVVTPAEPEKEPEVVTAGAPAPVGEVNPEAPASELPPLIIRESAIPEPIPLDDSVIEKINNLIGSPTPVATSSTPMDEEDDGELPTVNSILPKVIAPEPAPVQAEEPPKKSGSFFDQI